MTTPNTSPLNTPLVVVHNPDNEQVIRLLDKAATKIARLQSVVRESGEHLQAATLRITELGHQKTILTTRSEVALAEVQAKSTELERLRAQLSAGDVNHQLLLSQITSLTAQIKDQQDRYDNICDQAGTSLRDIEKTNAKITILMHQTSPTYSWRRLPLIRGLSENVKDRIAKVAISTLALGTVAGSFALGVYFDHKQHPMC